MPKKKHKKTKLFIYSIVLVVSTFFIVRGYLGFLQSPMDKNGSTKPFVVQKGETVQGVAERLEKEKFIRSAMAFRYMYKSEGSPTGIEPGTYKISSAMSIQELIKSLSQGSVDKWVTLLEGWRVEEMAIKLNKDLGINKEDFLKNAKEGYMFPDTYLFNSDATAETVASTMRNTFDKRYDFDLQAKIRAKGLTVEQGVILASLVEREARSDEARTKVAGIILKRLKIGMKLDIDAAVRYAKDTQDLKNGKKDIKFWDYITRADYSEVRSPYNTYLNNGLPPTPICNPSLSSLKAVAGADSSTPYLFYYHDSKGNSYYARTLEEHNENVANFR